VIVAYIDAYRASFGVEPICRVLKDHDYQIAPSTYYACKKRPPSERWQSDQRLLVEIRQVYHANYACYGVRKVWQALRHQGLAVGRDQVARLMSVAGLRGRTRLKRVRTTYADAAASRAPDLVQRHWDRQAPDRVWVPDFTYVPSREGTVYVWFLQDAFSRRILGFTVATSMGAQLVTKALDQAVSARRRADARFTGQGVIVHSDAGSQFTGLAFSQKLLDHGMAGSIGRVGTAHDNALMESTIGLYKSELIRSSRRAWTSRQEIETATTAWVAWFNEHRLHSKLGHLSPVKYEAAYNQNLDLQKQAA
jgi:transposase InsO family protein